MQIGFIGLGKMGKNMVFRFHEKGIAVVAWNRSEEPRDEVAQAGVETTETVEELVNRLDPVRTIWLMLPAGEVVDEFIDKLLPLLSSGDLVIDGGNSFYQDSLRRAEKLQQSGIHFMDIGVSGGPKGAREGACLMIGGSAEDFARIKDICEAAAAPEAYAHLGQVGAGHFAKMVHNGIEYGMMQALAEGTTVLKQSEFGYDLAQVMKLYNQQSVIASRLVGWAKDALEKDPNLKDISSKIAATGEGEWTVKTAHELGVEVPVIEKSLEVRVKSSEESESFRDKMVSALRGEFGQHQVKKS